MAVRCASASSAAENSRRRRRSRASARVSDVRSVTARDDPAQPLKMRGLAAFAQAWWKATERLFHHLRYDEEMFLRRRRILEDGVGNAPVGDDVRPLLHLHGNDRGHRLATFYIDLRQLLDEGENGVELASQVLDLVLGNSNARKLRDAANGIGIDRHGMLLESTKVGAPIAERPRWRQCCARDYCVDARKRRYSCHGRTKPFQHPNLRQPHPAPYRRGRAQGARHRSRIALLP